MKYVKFKRIVLISLLVLLIGNQTALAQVRWKEPKVEFSLLSGYDSNILRVSKDTDSNRVAGMVNNIELRAGEWVYWTQYLRSYFNIVGDYIVFSGTNLDDNWNFFIKFKTIADILDKPENSWIPAIKWNAEIRYAMVDRYYSDRAFGEEFYTIIDRISGQRLGLGNLFDRTVFRLSTGVEFGYDPLLIMGIEFQQELRNYTDIGDINSDVFYSLDNDESKVETYLTVNPVENIDFHLGYNWAVRDYDHKFANDINGNELPEVNRTYHYKDFDLAVFMEIDRFQGGIRYLARTRSDDYQGYFDYDFDKWNIKTAYFFTPQWQINALYESANKKYASLTFNRQILENEYITFEAGLSYLFTKNMSASLIFTNEIENSTYSKFTYTRVITYLNFSYQFP